MSDPPPVHAPTDAPSLASGPHDPVPHDPASARQAILDRIAAAARGRATPSTVLPVLVAVSKLQPWERVEPVLAAGQRVFGENRVQEAQTRWAGIRDRFPDLELRLIGPLQTNKVRDALELFDVIETLDRDKLAQAMADAIARGAPRRRVYVQVNTGEEPQKAGLAPAEVDAFIARLRDHYQLPPEGLMCIPPVDEPPGPHFALLARLAARNGLDRLSMGMSSDFETAVRFGATSVRVGSALFGAR
jgi:PLP dependent protein